MQATGQADAKREDPMKRRSILFLICAIFSLGTVTTAQNNKPYTLHYEVTMKSANFGNMGTRKLWIKGNYMRWDYQSGKLPLTLIKNKDGVFLIHPWNKVAAKYPESSNRGNPKALLPGPTGSPKAFVKAMNAKAKGQKTVNNQKCDVYTYTDPITKLACELWVSVDGGKPVQLLIKGSKGKADTITATYTKYQEGAAVSDSQFQIPKGYAVKPMPEKKLTSNKKSELASKK